MKTPFLSVTNNMSIAWGFVLALVTILDWNSVEKNPLESEIFTPFISRNVTVTVLEEDEQGGAELKKEIPYRYEVELSFNGPLFFLYFFIPVATLYLIGRMIGKANKIKPKG